MKTLLGLVLLFILATLPASADGYYVSVYGGANFDDVINTNGVSDNTGLAIGGTLGTHIKAVPGLRVEADVSFRQNDVDLAFGPGLTVSHETFAIMGNAAYDIPLAVGPLHPYVLVGVGYGHSEAILEDISLVKIQSSGVAYQLGAGLTTELADGVSLGIGYRYLKTEPLEVLGTELSDGSNHSVVAELKFAL